MGKMIQATNSINLIPLHKYIFNCTHCGYLWVGDSEDRVIKPGYKLTWEQVQTFIP